MCMRLRVKKRVMRELRKMCNFCRRKKQGLAVQPVAVAVWADDWLEVQAANLVTWDFVSISKFNSKKLDSEENFWAPKRKFSSKHILFRDEPFSLSPFFKMLTLYYHYNKQTTLISVQVEAAVPDSNLVFPKPLPWLAPVRRPCHWCEIVQGFPKLHSLANKKLPFPTNRKAFLTNFDWS